MNKFLLITLSCVTALVQEAGAQTEFRMGGDISMLSAYESVSTPYYDETGKSVTPLTLMRDDLKMNSMRVRLFVNPTETSSSKTGVIQDLDYVMQLGKRIKEAGMSLMLDFHYSDSWADPSAQSVPTSWYTGTLSSTNPSDATLEDSLYSYTKRCLTYLSANGAAPDYVQIGNEVSYGMLWRTSSDKCYTSNSASHSSWKRFARYLNAAGSAVREVCPSAKIILHIERSGQSGVAKAFFNRMETREVDYDIIGLSYYPFFHGELSSLSTTLSALEESFPDKPVHIVETAYYYQYFPSDADYVTTDTWAATADGQSSYISDLCEELAKHDNVQGLYYWFPEENGNGGSSWSASKVVITKWLNRGLWDNSTHKLNAAAKKLQQFLTLKDAASVTDVREESYYVSGIYSVTGCRLQSEPAHGVYIKNGKKIVR